MIEWLRLPDSLREETLYQANNQTGISAKAIEKDWWITLVLKAIQLIPDADQFIFKGGTSLSKGWGLIDRFSEDIDLALDKNRFGPDENFQKKAITELRRKSSLYVRNELKAQLNDVFMGLGLSSSEFTLITPNLTVSDQDPEIIEIHYKSLLESNNYLADKVILEISVRSMREPFGAVEINSMLNEVFTQSPWSYSPFRLQAVLPQRTFLEKIFLMHEEFLKPVEKIRSFRMSRHLYDLERMMDTTYALDAIKDHDLFDAVISHRKRFMRLSNIDYNKHKPETIDFIPPKEQYDAFRKDYNEMRLNMIYGDSPGFEDLLIRLVLLRSRLRETSPEKK